MYKNSETSVDFRADITQMLWKHYSTEFKHPQEIERLTLPGPNNEGEAKATSQPQTLKRLSTQKNFEIPENLIYANNSKPLQETELQGYLSSRISFSEPTCESNACHDCSCGSDTFPLRLSVCLSSSSLENHTDRVQPREHPTSQN